MVIHVRSPWLYMLSRGYACMYPSCPLCATVCTPLIICCNRDPRLVYNPSQGRPGALLHSPTFVHSEDGKG